MPIQTGDTIVAYSNPQPDEPSCISLDAAATKNLAKAVNTYFTYGYRFVINVAP